MRLTMFSLGAPVNWLVCSKNIIKSSTFEILSDVSSGAKSHAKYCTSHIWQCAVIGLTAPSTDGEDPLRKWPTIGWGCLLMAGLTSEWSLSGDQAQHWRKKEEEIGVGVKKKGERSECSLRKDNIFLIWPRFFPFFSHGVAFSIEFQEWDAYFEDLRVR